MSRGELWNTLNFSLKAWFKLPTTLQIVALVISCTWVPHLILLELQSKLSKWNYLMNSVPPTELIQSPTPLVFVIASFMTLESWYTFHHLHIMQINLHSCKIALVVTCHLCQKHCHLIISIHIIIKIIIEKFFQSPWLINTPHRFQKKDIKAICLQQCNNPNPTLCFFCLRSHWLVHSLLDFFFISVQNALKSYLIPSWISNLQKLRLQLSRYHSK